MLEAPRFELKDLPQDYYRHLLQMEGLILQHLDLELYHLIKLLRISRYSRASASRPVLACSPVRRTCSRSSLSNNARSRTMPAESPSHVVLNFFSS